MSPTLSRAQLDILTLLDRNLDEDEILEIKRLIVDYLSKKTDDSIDQFWKEKKISNTTMDKWLNGPS